MDDYWDPFGDPSTDGAPAASSSAKQTSSAKHPGNGKSFSAQSKSADAERSSIQTAEASIAPQPTVGAGSTFTLEQAIDMQEQLIAKYIDIEFQEKMFTAMGKTFGDRIASNKARKEVTWAVQAPIIKSFGFEPTTKGLMDSVRAFYPYNEIPAVAARNDHMGFLIDPTKQDAMWKGQVRRKVDVETGLPDNTTLAPLLSLAQGLELEDLLIAAYSTPEFQEELYTELQKAGGDQAEYIRARQRVCLPVQAPVLEKFGFPPTRRGVKLSMDAFKPLNAYPDLKERNLQLDRLMNPQSARDNVDAQVRSGDPIPEEKPVAGVGLSIRRSRQSQHSRFEVLEIACLKERPEVTLPEDTIVCSQFVVNAAYPQVLQELSQVVVFGEDATANGSSSERDSDDILFVSSADGYTWMQELLSLAMPVQGMFAHRITVVHTVAPSLPKFQSGQQRFAEALWQRRLYSFTEVTDLFRFTPAAAAHSERTLVWRSIEGLQITNESGVEELKRELAHVLERDNQKWISHFNPDRRESDGLPDTSLGMVSIRGFD